MSEFIDKYSQNIWLPYTQMQNHAPQLEVKTAKGSTIFLQDGTKLIDGISSWWSVSHGYNHPYITKKITAQLKELPHIMMAGFAAKPTYKLAHRLANITLGADAKVFFSDSGSTAVEVAMKMSVQYFLNQQDQQKCKILSFKNSYHGDTMGGMSLADPQDSMHAKFKHYLPKQFSVKLPENDGDFKEYQEFLNKNHQKIAALIIEPLVQCAGGMKFHSPETLERIIKITKKHNILTIFDECAVGFYRLGKKFAFNFIKEAQKPDILCVGKALTGGFVTLAATIASQKIFNQFLSDSNETALMHGPTFMGNPLACAAANASLDLFEQEDYAKKVAKISQILNNELSNIKNCRILGSLAAIDHQFNWQECQELRKFYTKNGVFLRPFAGVIYTMPPLNISEKDLLKITNVIKKGLRTLL